MGSWCHTQRVASGALHRRPSLRLPLTLCTHLVLIHKLGLQPHRIARGTEGSIPERTLYKLFAYEPPLTRLPPPPRVLRAERALWGKPGCVSIITNLVGVL